MSHDYDEFVTKIKQKSGIDLYLYKEAQMKRRLTTLRDRRGFGNFRDYYQSLHGNGELFNELLDRMTINVSEFYRNRQRWDVLEKKVLPHLLKENRKIKVWSAACSTGEEPYTLAIILSQYIPLEKIKVIATDIDEKAIQRAELGVYPERSLREMPNEVKKQYFTQQKNLYKINNNIKQCVIFKKQNLLADRYESYCDLIVCRNVLIYFTEEAKSRIYTKFSEALNKGGIFFVGSTEQIFTPNQYSFRSFDTFFYKKE
ncbi:protein-glutamate O-methyltransferase CheR [Halobacillus shinanisalinarum]|uniref:protein-glutamate O-methyltransferase n=1 Tax=Halobacillus shinanisalinarum TaxID=2932258 RepID=A0ABY4GZF3_9BACI|nr:protein-glutamate O-methyltransferase CheR [Halobacillus shinanisalinarum]UOQ93581.1 protein-glutamate O-methyltransferase CheR [Halobacillus shinanisalinarum]